MNGIEQAEAIAECRVCQWNKNCISPPMMTRQEIESIVKKDDFGDGEDKDKLSGSLLKALLYAGKDQEAPVCKVFAERLRQSSDLSVKIKDLMQNWE